MLLYACHVTQYEGIYTEDTDILEQYLFLYERKAFSDLCVGLTEPCLCQGSIYWTLESFIQVVYGV